MASTQKKPEKTKQTAAGKKSGGAKSQTKRPSQGKGKAASTASRRKPRAYMPNVLARGIAAAVCAFLALLVILGMFQVHGVVLDGLCGGIRGLIGHGFWFAAPALLWASWVLVFCREKRPTGRLWCLGLLPVVGGAFLHVVLGPTHTTLVVSQLWREGLQGVGGGVISGSLGVLFTAGFSAIGAGAIFLLAFLTLFAGAAHVTPSAIQAAAARWQQARQDRQAQEDLDYEDEVFRDEEDARLDPVEDVPVPPVTPQVTPFWSRRKKAPDLPLDEAADPAPAAETARKSAKDKTKTAAPPSQAQQAAETLQTGEKAPFFDHTSHVRRPDQVLEDLREEAAPPTEEGPLWQPVGEGKPTKAQRQAEIQQEAHAVTQTIEKTLEESQGKDYVFPSLDLLTPPSGEKAKAARQELTGTMERLSGVLTSFGIDGHVTGAVQGPAVTRYEVALEQGVRLNKLTNLSDDVALALGVTSVRIAPVPGKISVVGIEVPNQVVIPVPIREVLESPAFRRHKSSVAFSVGKDIGGNYIVGDCSKLPHMLIAGTTGSGKSVCINSLLISMLYKSTPEELRLIMVDPKMVELGIYNGIPHLLIPVVTDPKKAAGALQWAVTEMMKRYRLFAEAGVRELSSYNHWAEGQEGVDPLPKVVIVIDELADLMLVAAKEVEESICRVAQMGRAAGMHLVIATQRPSADVITGLMKANIPSRIAFAVASSLESRIILDNTGAEKLVGKGDMLWFPLGSGKPLRVQGCFISDEEVAAVVGSVKENATPEYDDEVMAQIEQHAAETEKKGKHSGGAAAGAFPAGEGEEDQDELFPAGVDVILELGQASVSLLQRRLKLGYARAARLMDQMEEKGIVGPSEGAKPRQILITKEQWVQMQSGEPLAQDNPPVEEEILSFDPIPQQYEE